MRPPNVTDSQHLPGRAGRNCRNRGARRETSHERAPRPLTQSPALETPFFKDGTQARVAAGRNSRDREVCSILRWLRRHCPLSKSRCHEPRHVQRGSRPSCRLAPRHHVVCKPRTDVGAHAAAAEENRVPSTWSGSSPSCARLDCEGAVAASRGAPRPHQHRAASNACVFAIPPYLREVRRKHVGLEPVCDVAWAVVPN
jgi:hypothetical protein